MNKKYFAVRLIPFRPDFVQTMTDNEKNIMQQHSVYWQRFMDKDLVPVFGPVIDPKSIYGIGIIVMDKEAQVEEFMKNDPATEINHTSIT